MRRLILFPALIFFVSITSAQTSQQSTPDVWSTFTFDKGKLSVEFPAEPVRKGFQYMDQGHALDAERFFVKTEKDFYQLTVYKIPYDFPTLGVRLDYAVGKAVYTIRKIQKARHDRIVISGCTGSDWIGQSQPIPIIIKRMVITPKRAYLLEYLSTEGGESAQAVALRFVASFKFTDDSPCGRK
jgi:hypothetical protein